MDQSAVFFLAGFRNLTNTKAKTFDHMGKHKSCKNFKYWEVYDYPEHIIINIFLHHFDNGLSHKISNSHKGFTILKVNILHA